MAAAISPIHLISKLEADFVKGLVSSPHFLRHLPAVDNTLATLNSNNLRLNIMPQNLQVFLTD